MTAGEFENYLSLLSGLLRLDKAQRRRIADELRDHMEQRLDELLADGVAREDAVARALDEFGDAASLAADFARATKIRTRRLIMKLSISVACMMVAAALLGLWLAPPRTGTPPRTLAQAPPPAVAAGPVEYAPVRLSAGARAVGLGPMPHAGAKADPSAVGASPPRPAKLRAASRPAKPAGPTIEIEARFIRGPAGHMVKLGLLPDKSYVAVSRARIDEQLHKVAQIPDAQTLSSPRVVTVSGQTARISVRREVTFVRDYRYRPATAEAPADMVPIVDSLATGIQLSVCPTTTSDGRVTLKLQPQFAELLSARRCTATVRLGAQSKKVSWQEQTLLLAGARLTPTDALGAIKPDEAYVIPLVYSVQSAPPATVRLYAAGGTVKEEPRAAGTWASACPARRATAMIVTARRLEPRHPARR